MNADDPGLLITKVLTMAGEMIKNLIRTMTASVFLACVMSVWGFAADDVFQFPATGVRCAKRAMFLGIDDVSIPLRNNVVLEMSKPKIRPKGVLLPTRDDPK